MSLYVQSSYVALLSGVGDGEYGCVVHCAELQPVTEGSQRQSTDPLQCRGRDDRPLCQDAESCLNLSVFNVL